VSRVPGPGGGSCADGARSSIFVGGPDAVARRLLGMFLVRADGRCLRLVEVEAYGGLGDPASHAYHGRSARNATMWGPPGRLYVYLSYGVHFCANVSCGTRGAPGAILLRAGEPVSGVGAMRYARWGHLGEQDRHPGAPGGDRGERREDRDLARGPGRLGRAMGIDASYDGADLCSGAQGIALRGTPGGCEPDIVAGARIGVTKARDLPWRFVLPASSALSRRAPAPGAASGAHPPSRS